MTKAFEEKVNRLGVVITKKYIYMHECNENEEYIARYVNSNHEYEQFNCKIVKRYR